MISQDFFLLLLGILLIGFDNELQEFCKGGTEVRRKLHQRLRT